MANPMSIYMKGKGPNWLEPTLGKYVEDPLAHDNLKAKKKDADVTMRNHGDNQTARQIKNATFVGKGGK